MILKEIDKNITKPVIVLESQTIKINLPFDHESIVFVTRKMVKKIGLLATDEYLVATSASELATNIYRYAGKGEMVVSIVECEYGKGIEILAEDHGPGISNISEAIKDHYTTTPKSLGMGLPSVLRIMDELTIHSEKDKGTRVVTRKWSWT